MNVALLAFSILFPFIQCVILLSLFQYWRKNKDNYDLLININVDESEKEALITYDGENGGTEKDGEKKKKLEHANLKRLFGLILPELGLIILALIAMSIAVGSNLAMPHYFGSMIQAVIVEKSSSKLKEIVLTLLVVFAIGSVFSFVRGFLFEYAGQRLVARLRKKLFFTIMNQEIAFFDVTRTGELTNRLASDMSVVQTGVTSNISMVARNFLSVLGSIIILFVISWKLTLVMISIVPVISIGAVVYGSFVKKVRDFLFCERVLNVVFIRCESSSKIGSLKLILLLRKLSLILEPCVRSLMRERRGYGMMRVLRRVSCWGRSSHLLMDPLLEY